MSFDIYNDDADKNLRFLLGRSGVKFLVVFGVNPSTADKENSDQTITKVEGFSKYLPYRGFAMLNLYPLRCTNPKNLPLRFRKEHHDRNLAAIVEFVKKTPEIEIWAAWGDLIDSRPCFLCCLEKIHDALGKDVAWHQCGDSTAKANPRHPSRISYNNKFQDFDIGEYLKKKRKKRSSCLDCEISHAQPY